MTTRQRDRVAHAVAWAVALAAVLIGGVRHIANAQPGVIFSSDPNCASGSPYGFARENTEHRGVRWNSACRPGIGPGGIDMVELFEIPGSGNPPTQFSWGFDRVMEPPYSYGAAPRYVSWLMRFPGDNNGLCRDQDDQSVDCTNKLLIVTSGGPSCRVIMTYSIGRPGTQEANRIKFRISVDGGQPAETEYVYPTGADYYIQVKLTGSSAQGQRNGRSDVWINNPNQNAPTFSQVNVANNFGSCDAGFTGIGQYHNGWRLDANGRHRYLWARYQYGTVFRPNWAPTSAVPGPAAPTLTRVR